MKGSNNTRILVECALMVALATILSKIEIPLWIQGGSVTLCSMLPIIAVSYRSGTKWGLLTALVFSFIQMMLGFQNVLYCKTLLTQAACILLDYILAYTALGLAMAIGSVLKPAIRSLVFGSAAVIFIRFICSFVSGILIWGEYAPAGTPVWLYSLTYNGGYMLPELILTVGAVILLQRLILPKAAA